MSRRHDCRHAACLDDPLNVSLQLRGSAAARFEAEAKCRRRDPGELAAEILVNVVADNLFAAVLDQ